MSTAIVVLATVPSVQVGRKIAKVLVGERLAACVNLLPEVESHYRWEGKTEKARESLLIIKTTRARYPALERRLKAIHPYTVPEILGIAIHNGSAPYLRWIAQSTSHKGS